MVSLEAALELAPEHSFFIQSNNEEGTPLGRKFRVEFFQTRMKILWLNNYERSCIFLERAGYEHYEISNWAKSSDTQDFVCQHNLQYWRLHPL